MTIESEAGPAEFEITRCAVGTGRDRPQVSGFRAGHRGRRDCSNATEAMPALTPPASGIGNLQYGSRPLGCRPMW